MASADFFLEDSVVAMSIRSNISTFFFHLFFSFFFCSSLFLGGFPVATPEIDRLNFCEIFQTNNENQQTNEKKRTKASRSPTKWPTKTKTKHRVLNNNWNNWNNSNNNNNNNRPRPRHGPCVPVDVGSSNNFLRWPKRQQKKIFRGKEKVWNGTQTSTSVREKRNSKQIKNPQRKAPAT